VRVQKCGTYNPDATQNVDVNKVTESTFLALDRLLVYLADHKADVLDDFVTGLTSRYRSEVPNSFDNFTSFKRSHSKLSLKMLTDIPDLTEACTDLCLTLLNVPEGYAWKPQELELLQIDDISARYIPRYFQAKLLTELMVKEEAIKLLKNFFDFSARTYRTVERHENVTSIYEDDVNRGAEREGFIWISALLNEGKFAGRTDVCLLHEALKGFNDPELAYVIGCHADFVVIQKMKENFLLTRSSTLMDGPFCESCVHDTRVVSKIEHPSREFFEKLDQNL